MGEQPKIVMYGTPYCPYCSAARMLLKKKNATYEEISVSDDAPRRAEMEKLSGRRTVPQIFIDEEPIGGFDELYELDQQGELDRILGRD